MKREIAKAILDTVFEYGGKLNDTMVRVREECEEEDFHKYRRAVGKILEATFANVIEPIFDEHPDLKPDQLKSVELEEVAEDG